MAGGAYMLAATTATAATPSACPDLGAVVTPGTVPVTAVSLREGAGPTLAALVGGALRMRGVTASLVQPPAPCGRAPASRACRGAVLRALACGSVHAALLPVPAARPPDAVRMRDQFLEELGDAAPASRLACWAPSPAPRSLLDVADAPQYRLAPDALLDLLGASLDSACTGAEQEALRDDIGTKPSDALAGVVTTSDAGEASELRVALARAGVNASVVALPRCASPAASLPFCSRSPPPRFHTLTLLGPPPCPDDDDECAFAAYRLVKLGNALKLSYSPSAVSVLSRLKLNASELEELYVLAEAEGPVIAAAAMVARHSEWAGTQREVRVAVMVPGTTPPRETFDPSALRAAAALAETSAPAGGVYFKVEVVDGGCSPTHAFKYLTDARAVEWGALSALAGPACGAPFADVARQSAALALPLLAYTEQAAPAGHAGGAVVLAAGDARATVRAWGAWAAHVGWRRAAVLSELGARAALDVSELRLHVVLHNELPADTDDDDQRLLQRVTEWVTAAAESNARVLLVWVEDARCVRAALCAGARAGLAPPAAAWLLPALPPAALLPAPRDRHNCTHEELLAAAEGHLSAAPAWRDAWRPSSVPAWTQRWRRACALLAARCDEPPPHAALLYDALTMWRAALTRLLAARPAAIDDMHTPDVIRSMVEDVTSTPYEGVTGNWTWETADGARARAGHVVLRQWAGGALRHVARWDGALRPGPDAPVWRTADGAAPDDGTERCALQALADGLGADCRTALLALAALLLAAPAAALAGAAWHCKRRAEREYRRRLAALGLTRLGPEPGGLDRWEVPRERVVINRKLGTGAFGNVYGGHALLAEGRPWTAVAVKTLKPGATTEEKLDFLSEAEAMKRFDHENVVRLLGVVTKTEPVCTVMEFMLYGDLKNYLLARRQLAGRGEVSSARLSRMALDAARALSYLARLRYVHRDVAARNCLVSARRTLKLADFGMTRLVFESDYYRFGRKGMLPVRWMAPESLALGVFSPASDVWSFGVLLYEIVTFGSLPFQGLSNSEVLARVKGGRPLDLPLGLKPQLEGLIKSCWQQEQKARPSAADIAAFLAESPRLLAPCLELPLDALPLDAEAWRVRDQAEARWVSWGAPPSAATDTTYVSADAPPQDTDAFLP